MGRRARPDLRRVLIAGISGAGKTTLCRRLHHQLGLPRHELDALQHGPGWTIRPSFVDDVAAFTATDSWVCESQYHAQVGDLLWGRATIVIWLDYGRPTVMMRVLRRSLRRALLRTELFNGNREHWRDWVDPGHPIRFAWSNHASRRTELASLIARHPDLEVIRLRSPRETRQWLRELRDA